MLLIAAGTIAWGCHRQGVVWRSILSAGGCFLAAIAAVAIGLFELEWLERIVGLVDDIFTGVTMWFRTSWFGTLSESEFVGERRARVYWVVIGVVTFLVGCVLAVGIL
jgi:hypothetical protein